MPLAARLTVDLTALARNWRNVAALAEGAETAAVVKADAYGTGIGPAVRALSAAGCRTFFVARLEEGIATRRAAPDAAVYVLEGAPPGSIPLLAAAGLCPALCTAAQVEAYAAFSGAKAPAAIHVDTGMNRLGLTPAQARALAADPDRLAAIGAGLVMSHLACADRSGHPQNATQLALFREIRALFPGLRASLANSGGVALGRDFHFDLVRPGIALFGGAYAEGQRPLRAVMTAEAPVLQLREASGAVGYGATQTLAGPRRLATLGVGYADGYHRRAGSSDLRKGARVFLRGKAAPLVGRVSMDLMTVDVTDIPEAAEGDYAELFGANVPVDDVAEIAGTIGYELLTGVGRRFQRRYV